MFKKISIFVAVSLSLCAMSFAQVVTASEYFNQVSAKYASISDYESKANITIGKEKMRANIMYLAPNMMRMNFTDPAEQVIVFDGKKLTIYLPGYAIVLSQEANAATLATSEGLSLMRRYYSVSYERSQAPVPLEEGSFEMVVRLTLYRRTASEAFRTITLSIDPETKMIRRLDAVTPAGVLYRIDFSDYEINQGMTEQRFKYDVPSAANTYENFMFTE